MKPVKQFMIYSFTIVLTFFVSTHLVQAEAPSSSIEYQVKVQRATQAAVWAMPAVSVYDIELSIQRDLGGKVGDIAYLTKPMTSRHGFLTANDVTPYVTAGLSCKDGPLVIEVPPAGEKASFFGTIVDAWQTPLADVGPPGEDKGDGGTHEDQSSYAQTLKVYKLSEADNPPETTFIDAYPKRWNTLPVYDLTYFTDLNTVIQREPVLERDKAMMAQLVTLGIEKGKPFDPDEETQKALLEGLQKAYDWMQLYFVNRSTIPWWENRQWQVWQFAEGQPEAGFPYVTEDRILIDDTFAGD